MVNENKVNDTQNPNITDTSANLVAATPMTPPVSTTEGQITEAVPPTVVPASSEEVKPSEGNLQTIVVPSDFPEEAPAVFANTSVPTVVNPLEVKPEEVKQEAVSEVKPAVSNEETTKSNDKVSEYQEKLKKAQENYKPPSKFQMALTIFMFITFILFIIFLPDISENIRRLKNGPGEVIEPEPTTGTLVCTLENNTANLDKSYNREFKYEDNKLKSSVIETVTRGDITLDEALLDDLYNKCVTIKNGVEGVDGITVVCEYQEGLLIERERFDYKTFNTELINAAYAEAGSTVLEFDYEADIDEIMKSMLQSGFTCKKEK